MTQERTELSKEAEARITQVIRSLVDDQVERGVDMNRPMRCDSCSFEKSPLGSSQYGAYALCNDCLLEFTLALAKGDIENVAGYMTRRTDDSDSYTNQPPGSHLMEPRALHNRLSKRGEKLMPSNEPC